MFYYFKKGKNETEIQKKIHAIFGKGTVTNRTYQKFHSGDFSLDYAPQSGIPIKVDSDQIKTLLENNQCYTMWKIINIFKISKSVVSGENEK